jgi:hypothetical protein
MQGDDIAELRHSSKVSSIQRGVSHDWVVITKRSDGPALNAAEVFDDHTVDYELVEQNNRGDETFAHFEEV